VHDPILNVPAALVRAYTGFRLAIRIDSPDDWSRLEGIDAAQIAWIETSLDVACTVRPRELLVDIVLSDPAREAGRLNKVLAWCDALRPPRITIPVVHGVSVAGAAAIALGLPVRILPRQPDWEEVAELDELLDRYLCDPSTAQPVEFFHSLLRSFLHSSSGDLWETLELDPDLFPRIASAGAVADTQYPPQVRGFVGDHFARVMVERRDCVYCAFQRCCAGYFKWPDVCYDCFHVKGLLGRISDAARRLRADLNEMAELEL
jgi:hypothetical protein